MDEVKGADKDIDIYKLVFIGSNKENFNFNIFKMPLNFLLVIYNGEITLKEAEISQINLEKKMEELKYNYKPENVEEKEEINCVLMQANDMLEYRDKIIEAFRDGTFSSEHLKKSDDAAYDYVLKDVEKFIQKIKSITENINLSLFEGFFESSSPADYAKELINVKDPNENKEIVAEIKNRILDLKDRIKKMSEKIKNKSEDKTLRIIEEILDYIKGAQKFFSILSKVDKWKPRLEESIARRIKLRRERIVETEGAEKNINNKLFKNYFTNYRNPSDIYKNLREAEGSRNENRVYLIKEVLNRMKKVIENVSKNRTFTIEEHEKIINIVYRIFTLID